jgi:hypothetical protein
MRTILPVVALVAAVSCGGSKVVRQGQQDPLPPPPKDVAAERAADEGAFQFLYIPAQKTLLQTHKGEWIAIAAGRVIPATGTEPAPVRSMEEADALSRKAAPDAVHRFLFQVGEEGDVTWELGGCELQHVLGDGMLKLLTGAGVDAKNVGPGERMQVRINGNPTELTVATADENRMYLRPQVGAPGDAGAARENFCVATGFAGTATMSAATAAGLEMWEIPGTCHVRGAVQSGDCRRARARLAWPNTSLDFVVPVAVWAK